MESLGVLGVVAAVVGVVGVFLLGLIRGRRKPKPAPPKPTTGDAVHHEATTHVRERADAEHAEVTEALAADTDNDPETDATDNVTHLWNSRTNNS